jgi:transcriptional regulator with XRE-family HTH domain
MTRTHGQLSEQLRQSILNADISRYRIAQETGLSESALSRFVNGVAGLSLESIDKIGECLDLQINDKSKAEPLRTTKKGLSNERGRTSEDHQ